MFERGMRAIGAAALLALAFAASAAEASQTGRRPAPCNVRPASTVNDERVVDWGNDYTPIRRTGERMKMGGNITDIVRVINHTDCPITLSKNDWKGVLGTAAEVIEVPPRGSYDGHMWVPWRTNVAGEAIWISFRGRPYFSIWQMRGRIAFRSHASIAAATAISWNNYLSSYDFSPNVPGLHIEGGPRILHVATTTEGEPFFKFEGVPED